MVLTAAGAAMLPPMARAHVCVCVCVCVCARARAASRVPGVQAAGKGGGGSLARSGDALIKLRGHFPAQLSPALCKPGMHIPKAPTEGSSS